MVSPGIVVGVLLLSRVNMNGFIERITREAETIKNS